MGPLWFSIPHARNMPHTGSKLRSLKIEFFGPSEITIHTIHVYFPHHPHHPRGTCYRPGGAAMRSRHQGRERTGRANWMQAEKAVKHTFEMRVALWDAVCLLATSLSIERDVSSP
jgi:hypothetical protein